PLPFPLLPLPPPLTAATVLLTPEAAAELAPLAATLLLLPWPLFAEATSVPELDEPQIVSLLAAFRAPPCAADLSCARPCVARWTFRRTSPIDDEMRVTPCLAGCTLACRDGWTPCPFVAWRIAVKPPRGTGMRSTDGARGLPCSIGARAPVPPSERPVLPLAKAVA